MVVPRSILKAILFRKTQGSPFFHGDFGPTNVGPMLGNSLLFCVATGHVPVNFMFHSVA